jgi:hypothetical protein
MFFINNALFYGFKKSQNVLYVEKVFIKKYKIIEIRNYNRKVFKTFKI